VHAIAAAAAAAAAADSVRVGAASGITAALQLSRAHSDVGSLQAQLRAGSAAQREAGAAPHSASPHTARTSEGASPMARDAATPCADAQLRDMLDELPPAERSALEPLPAHVQARHACARAPGVVPSRRLAP
jgi:hypothetical protein